MDLTTAAEIAAGTLAAAGAVAFAPEILGAAALAMADAEIGALGGAAASLAEGALGALSDAAVAAAENLGGAAEAGIAALGDGLAAAMDGIAGGLRSAGNALGSAAAGLAGNLGGALGGMLGSPASAQPSDPSGNPSSAASNPASGSYIPDSQGDLGAAQRDPLVIDLAGTGLNLINRSAFSPYFAFTGSGFAHNTGWIGAGTGFLTLVGADGVVHDGTQLFGTGTQAGFDALRTLDSNGDGVIDASDADFCKLVVRQDINGDGIRDSLSILERCERLTIIPEGRIH